MQKLGYCGDDCLRCPRYIATMSGETEQLNEVAKIWKEADWRDEILPEEMICYGCNSVSVCSHGVRECGIERGVSNCGRCEDYPCEKVSSMFQKSGRYDEICRKKFPEDIYLQLKRAFFMKEENLEREHQRKREETI